MIGTVVVLMYMPIFELAGFILLVAMIGAIVLTLRERPGTRRQDIAAQIVAAHPGVALASGQGVITLSAPGAGAW